MLTWTIRGIGAIGGGLVTAAILWWGIVFYGVSVNTGTPLTTTAPCLLYTSDMCSLAMALCGGQHFLGLTRYSNELIWFGFALAGLSIGLTACRSRLGIRSKG
jgi:hypothetical protein